jgi:hypothetical protein
VDLDAAIGPDGSRLLLKQTSPSTKTRWLIPDLHANTAALFETDTSIVGKPMRFSSER